MRTGFLDLRHPLQQSVDKRSIRMSTAILRTKGQITIPVEVRNALNLKAGDRIEFVQIAPDRYEFVAATREVTAIKGMFGPAKKPLLP